MRKIIIITAFIIIVSSLFIFLNLTLVRNSLEHIYKPKSKIQIAISSETLPKHNVSILDRELADGFDYPMSSSKLIRFEKFDLKKTLGLLNSGEEYIGIAKNEADYISTIAKGTVVFAGDCGEPFGNTILILHKYYENGEVNYILSEYTNLNKLYVKLNESVKRHKVIGTFKRDRYNKCMHFELRNENIFNYPVFFNPFTEHKNIEWIKENYKDPSAFIKSRRQLTIPASEKLFILVRKSDYKMEVYRSGQKVKSYDISLSQEAGKKMNEGDNRTPEGEYKICQKFKGPFTEKDANGSGLFLGTRWIGLSYPNIYDAENARNKGLINSSEYDSIVSSLRFNEMPPKNTYLGGGIGIHGWNGDWPEDLRDITWGCISMKKYDLEECYDLLSFGTIVVITK